MIPKHSKAFQLVAAKSCLIHLGGLLPSALQPFFEYIQHIFDVFLICHLSLHCSHRKFPLAFSAGVQDGLLAQEAEGKAQQTAEGTEQAEGAEAVQEALAAAGSGSSQGSRGARKKDKAVN